MALLQVDRRVKSGTLSGIASVDFIEWQPVLGLTGEFYTVDAGEPIVTGTIGDNFGTLAACSTNGGNSFSLDTIVDPAPGTITARRQNQEVAGGAPYQGFFTVGDQLYLHGAAVLLGAVDIIFATTVAGVGFSWQNNAAGDGVRVDTATLTLYDAAGNVLGTFTQTQVMPVPSEDIGNGTAKFLGAALESGATIKRARFNVQVESANANFAINRVEIGAYDPGTPATPGPIDAGADIGARIAAGGGGIELVIAQHSSRRALDAQSLHPAADCLAKMRVRLHDAEALWSVAELMDWYNDGYRELLALTGAIRRHRPIPLPPRRAMSITQEWEDRHVDGPVGKVTHAVASGYYQTLGQWEVEQSVA